MLHILSGIILNLMAPFQFARSFRRRWPTWHRWSGWLLIISGLLAVLSALWMNQFFPAYGGFLKYSGIIVNSVGLIASMSLSLWMIRAGDIQSHRVWMMRSIAFSLGSATQRLFILPVFHLYGELPDLVIGLVIWFGFVLNLSVVEWILLRERRGGTGKLNANSKMNANPKGI